MFGMTPFEKKSFDLFNAFHDFENDFFGDSNFASFKTDIKDTGDSYVLDAELPGFNKEDIALDLNGDILTLTAKHSDSSEDKEEDGKYIRRERSNCSYCRSFDVSAVDTENIQAEYTNGILSVTMPKKAPTADTTKRLEIK